MKEQLISILSGLGYPVYLQGSLNSENDYPDSFFTFWNFDNPESAFYDNNPNKCVWGFWVYFYSTSPVLVEKLPEQARKKLREKGWILEGKASDINVGKPTHTGAFFTTYKIENY